MHIIIEYQVSTFCIYCISIFIRVFRIEKLNKEHKLQWCVSHPLFKCIIIHHNYCMVVKLYFEITLSNLHLSMHYYYYILSALNSIFYINFILVLYI